mmetsp:Transcript_2005/g.7141  ORF Transcript_2005/g.7141 Transcript_2005/m.7141 type:complete len:946 (+) Transcript_2005:200-3037(+)
MADWAATVRTKRAALAKLADAPVRVAHRRTADETDGGTFAKGGRWAQALNEKAVPRADEKAAHATNAREYRETQGRWVRDRAVLELNGAARRTEFKAAKKQKATKRYSESGCVRPEYSAADRAPPAAQRAQALTKALRDVGSARPAPQLKPPVPTQSSRPQSAPARRPSVTKSKQKRPSTARTRSYICDAPDDAPPEDEPSKYFGAEARIGFFERFRELVRDSSHCDDLTRPPNADEAARLAWDPDEERFFDDDSCDVPLVADMNSPREAFARAVAQIVASKTGKTLLPEPLFVRSVENADELDFSHRGYGDNLAVVLAKIVTTLPHLERLSMRDNRLTDVGISALLEAVCADAPVPSAHVGLVSLDLSQNELDLQAVQSLANYLARHDCSLAGLQLDSADIDDAEMAVLISALERNSSLTELSLSSNFLGGTSEKMLVAGSASGSAALATTLQMNFHLAKLDLSWNRLGAPSGAAIGEAISLNKGLSWFSLAFNCIGDAGAQQIGRALDLNNTLTYLDVSNNGIRNRGAQVIAEGLRDNARLISLQLGGNPVGSLGGRALLASLNCARRPRELGLQGCDFGGDDDEPGRFDPAGPAGKYSLDLSVPHHWMIARSLRFLAASRNGCNFEKLEEQLSAGCAWRDVRLVDRRSASRSAIFETYRPASTEASAAPVSFRTSGIIRDKVAKAAMGSSIAAIVARFDKDKSGELSVMEVRELMRRTLKISPKDLTDAEISDLVYALDIDNSGSLSVDELVKFLESGQGAFFAAGHDDGALNDASQKPSLSVASAATNRAASLMQSKLRGLLARVDLAQKKELWASPHLLPYPVAAALMAVESAGVGVAGIRGVLGAVRKFKKAVHVVSREREKASNWTFAKVTARQMRVEISDNESLDSATGEPWRVPATGALKCVFEALPLPPIELSLQNATGLAGTTEFGKAAPRRRW